MHAEPSDPKLAAAENYERLVVTYSMAPSTAIFRDHAELQPCGQCPLARGEGARAKGGESWPASSLQTIRWSSSDADGESLVTSLQYPREGGATWSALAANLQGTVHGVATSALGGSTQALICVIASDRVYTGADTSDASFTVA